jgi:hypothetical protein
VLCHIHHACQGLSYRTPCPSPLMITMMLTVVLQRCCCAATQIRAEVEEAWQRMEVSTNARAAALVDTLNVALDRLSGQVEGAVAEQLEVCVCVCVCVLGREGEGGRWWSWLWAAGGGEEGGGGHVGGCGGGAAGGVCLRLDLFLRERGDAGVLVTSILTTVPRHCAIPFAA